MARRGWTRVPAYYWLPPRGDLPHKAPAQVEAPLLESQDQRDYQVISEDSALEEGRPDLKST
jgi:hypothetical protein